MKVSKQAKKSDMLIGLEFDKLTHWERYVLNRNLAKMEKKLYPDVIPEPDNESTEIWRGERRSHHRLDVRKLGIRIKLDLSTLRGGIYSDVHLLNLSPMGCCVQMTHNPDLEPGARIPRLVLPLPEEKEELFLRARIIHVGECEQG
jgi:hypothetical protein